MWILAAAALVSSAHAADDLAYVFVSPFQARDSESRSLALQLTTALNEELGRHNEVRAIPIEKVGMVHDTQAELYASSCPPNEFVGCAFVLGDTANANFAIAGVVAAEGEGSRVEVHIIDVSRSEDVLSFQVDIASGSLDAAFTEGVVRVLIATAQGKTGAGGDIRAGDEEEDEAPKVDTAEANRQLAQLDKEIGGVSSVDRREGARIERPKITEEQLLSDMGKEGSKPWERLNMSPREYLRYRNSGLNLTEWRRRNIGRKGQLLARPHIGFQRGPVDAEYYLRSALSSEDLSTVETYAWQSAVSSGGLNLGGSVGYGLLPELEVGLTAGYIAGRYELDQHTVTEGQPPSVAPEAQDFGNPNLYVGVQALGGLMPAWSIRPVVGAQITYLVGSAADSAVTFTPEMPTFSAPSSLLVGGLFGAEARLGSRGDLFVHVPLQVLVGGTGAEESHVGRGFLDKTEAPPALSTVGAGLLVGFQLRFLGERPGKTRFDRYEDEGW
jgi:hypothetical protein